MTVKWNPKVGKFLRFFDENEEIQDCAANPNKPRELLSIITFILTLAFFIFSFMLLFKTIDISTLKSIAILMVASRSVLVLMYWHSNYKNMAMNDLILVLMCATLFIFQIF